MARTVSSSIDIAAPPARVWALVSDLPGMGRFSPENTGGVWQSGGGPVAGAVFRGTNAQGRRRWSTRSTVVRAEPGTAFAFEVRAGGLPVAQWSYELAPTAAGCTLTETWEDRRGWLVTRLGALTTGVQDRTAFTSKSIDHTLAAVKAAAEGSAPA
jgi:uncharacterized protein YndB with AHSA1/START domain